MFSNNLLKISDYANYRPPFEVLTNSKTYDINQIYTVNGTTQNARIIFMNENLWTTEDKKYINKIKKMLSNMGKTKPNWLRDGEFLRMEQLLGNDSNGITINDKQFIQKYLEYLDFGQNINFNLNNKEVGLLNSGCIDILGVDKKNKPAIIFDLESIENSNNYETLLQLIPKIQAFVRITMHIPGKIEVSKIIINYKDIGIMIDSKSVIEKLQEAIMTFENQFDELFLINFNNECINLVKAYRSNSYKVNYAKSNLLVLEEQKKHLDIILIPSKFGGNRTIPLSWPPKYPQIINHTIRKATIEDQKSQNIIPFHYEFNKELFDNNITVTNASNEMNRNNLSFVSISKVNYENQNQSQFQSEYEEILDNRDKKKSEYYDSRKSQGYQSGRKSQNTYGFRESSQVLVEKPNDNPFGRLTASHKTREQRPIVENIVDIPKKKYNFFERIFCCNDRRKDNQEDFSKLRMHRKKN